MMVMSMIVTMSMIMVVAVMFSLLTGSKNALYRVSKLLDGSLEIRFICLYCIILEGHCPSVESNLEILYALLERYVLTNLLCAVLAIEFNHESNFLDLAFLLLCWLAVSH